MTVTKGWSATKQIIGKDVYNDKNEKVGVVEDLIIASDKAVSYAIIGAGGFGWATRCVASRDGSNPVKRCMNMTV